MTGRHSCSTFFGPPSSPLVVDLPSDRRFSSRGRARFAPRPSLYMCLALPPACARLVTLCLRPFFPRGLYSEAILSFLFPLPPTSPCPLTHQGQSRNLLFFFPPAVCFSASIGHLYGTTSATFALNLFQLQRLVVLLFSPSPTCTRRAQAHVFFPDYLRLPLIGFPCPTSCWVVFKSSVDVSAWCPLIMPPSISSSRNRPPCIKKGNIFFLASHLFWRVVSSFL